MSLSELFENEDKVVTKMGRSFLSERVVYRGKDLHHELGELSWLELFAFGITGRHYSPAEVKVLNYIWLSTSYPDKSIWPNHIVALAGSYKTTPGLAMSAGIAACEANIFGGKPFRTAIDFFIRAKHCRDDKGCLQAYLEAELAAHKVIFGYGRPLASTDERVPHLIHFIRKSAFKTTQHFDIAIEIAHLLKQQKGLNMNVAALYAALGADLGFTPKAFHTFMTLCFVAGMPPCYLEADEQTEGTFLPVRCDRVNYVGVEKRHW